jgi:hypothetical protein
MPEHVRGLVHAEKPGAIALVTVLLRWPDRKQPIRFVEGFHIVGEVENSGLFNQVPEDKDPIPLLGACAEEEVRTLLASPRPRDAEEIALTAVREEERGHGSPAMTAAELDSLFGVGGWSFMLRFMHEQASGKRREIDNGKLRHNKASRMLERLLTNSADFVPSAVMLLVCVFLATLGLVGWESCQPDEILKFLPDWLAAVLGIDDLKDAYRQCPVALDHLRFSIIADWCPVAGGWRFRILYGHAYGLVAAVMNFNRLPTLAACFARRAFGVMVAPYFDDNATLDLQSAAGSGQAVMHDVFGRLHVLLSSVKCFPYMVQRVFLGVSNDLSSLLVAGTIHVDLKYGFRESLDARVEAQRATGRCGSGVASKLRGSFGWASTQSFGKCGRVGQRVLIQRQYADGNWEAWDKEFDKGVCLLQRLLFLVEGRYISVLGLRAPPW